MIPPPASSLPTNLMMKRRRREVSKKLILLLMLSNHHDSLPSQTWIRHGIMSSVNKQSKTNPRTTANRIHSIQIHSIERVVLIILILVLLLTRHKHARETAVVLNQIQNESSEKNDMWCEREWKRIQSQEKSESWGMTWWWRNPGYHGSTQT